MRGVCGGFALFAFEFANTKRARNKRVGLVLIFVMKCCVRLRVKPCSKLSPRKQLTHVFEAFRPRNKRKVSFVFVGNAQYFIEDALVKWSLLSDARKSPQVERFGSQADPINETSTSRKIREDEGFGMKDYLRPSFCWVTESSEDTITFITHE